MALDKDILGEALYEVRQSFSNQTRAQLLATYGDDNGIRLAACKAEANAIIEHIKAYAQINATIGTGLTASTFPVVGESLPNIIE